MKLQIAANTFYQIIGKIISSGSSFLITILLVKKYSQDAYGDFEKITSFVALFYLAVDFGINAVVLREIKKAREKKEALYNLVLGTRIVISIGMIFLCLAVLSFLPSFGNQGFTSLVKFGVIICSLTIFFQGLTMANNLLFQESLRYDKAVLASSFAYLIFLGLTYLLVQTNLPLIFAIILYVVFFIFYALFSFVMAKTLISKILPVFDKNKILALLKTSLPLGITLVFNVIYFRSDIVFLSILRPTSEVAVYGLAYRFFEVALVFPTFFNNALYPVLLERKNLGVAKVREMLFAAGGFLLGVSIVGTVLIFYLAPWLIGLTTKSYAPSILSLRILILSLPVFFLTSLLMWFLITLEKQKILALIYGSTMVINIVLNLIFIPRSGFIASSVITGVTEALVLIFALLAIRKEISYNSLNNNSQLANSPTRLP